MKNQLFLSQILPKIPVENCKVGLFIYCVFQVNILEREKKTHTHNHTRKLKISFPKPSKLESPGGSMS